MPWEQLLQVAPDIQVEVISEREALLLGDGGRCAITQSAPGCWRVIRGQIEPRLEGWYSEAYSKWEPGVTLVFQPAKGATRLTTRLELQPR
jgi:hypothetical protein